MSDEYREMWKSLGLDLEAHDALLAALGQGYKDIFMTQENRPKGMEYFDFVISQVHGLRVKELLDEKATGRTYIMESMPVEKALESKKIPTLRIETDYSMEDVGQLKTRIEAFIEQIK
jgi:hypothetical protein